MRALPWAAIDSMRMLGFVQQRTLLRMVLGANAVPGDPHLQFGIAEPAVG